MKRFNSLPRLVQILLLLIPGVNWVVEVVVRWSAACTHKDFGHILFALVVTFIGLVFGWVDVIWCLLFKHLVYAK